MTAGEEGGSVLWQSARTLLLPAWAEHLVSFLIYAAIGYFLIELNKGTRNGVAEVAPHLKEDGDGKGERDGSCRARTRNDGKRAAKHAGGIDLGRNRRADHDGTHEHGLQSSADDNALLDRTLPETRRQLGNLLR